MTHDGLVVVRGGGDLGTGVAHRLWSAGYRVVVLETERPTVLRRTVAFAQAALSGSTVVEGVEARRIAPGDLDEFVANLGGSGAGNSRTPRLGWVPVVVDPCGRTISDLRPDAVVDARMAKVNLGTVREDAGVTIGLGPGFTAGEDVDYVVETARGHSLGRLLTGGSAEPDTGIPGVIAGVGAERVIRAPASGPFAASRAIGDLVREGDTVGTVGGCPARARVTGLIRGLVAEGIELREGQKMGDVDPRGGGIDHTRISDKARSVGGAVLEGLLKGGVLPGAQSGGR